MAEGKRTSEWTRCSEGFFDIKKIGRETTNEHNRSRKKKFSDILKHTAFQTANLDAEIKSQEILWSSSDSENDAVSEIHIGKRKKIAKHGSPRKRKLLQVSRAPSSSETFDIITSESDSEIGTQASAVNAGSAKTEEGSIQGFESASDEEKGQVPTAEQLSQTTRDVDDTDSPSISGSTQSVSPPRTNTTGSGVKASDWVKSLQLKTPSKSEYQGEIVTAEDSAKKKKKHSRGGLAEQLSRLQAREKSAVRMWSHQQNKTAPSSQDTSKAISMRVVGFEVLYSMQVVKCAVLVNEEETEHKLVMFPVSQSEQLNLQVGTEITVYPPWQQLEMNEGQTIMLCTRYCQVNFQPEEDLEAENFHLLEGKKDSVTASWNCPCVQGLCKLQSQCPAFKFPLVPGLVISKNISSSGGDEPAAEKSEIVSPEKHLHTVADNAEDVSTVTDSLLESIERSSEHVGKHDRDSISVNFKGIVHRVNSLGKENRLLLLVEDGRGAVCEIQMSSRTLEEAGISPDKMEGKSFQFAGFHIHCRKIRDKEPSLFSLIDSVWSGKRGPVCSQDSQNSSQDNNEKRSSLVDAPSFCYTLNCDENDNAHIKPCTASIAHYKPIKLEQLVTCQTETNTRRCNFVGRILYVHQYVNVSSTHSGPVLYLTDQSLQGSEQPYLMCHITVNCHNKLPSLKNGKQICSFQFKDALIDQGQLVADTYTKILPLSVRGDDSEETEKINDAALPQLDHNVKKLDLCSISGIITEVDEDSAYSWEVCNFCSSDQLSSQPLESGDSTSTVVCKNCQKIVTSPETKMKMEILVKCDSMPNSSVRVDLLQSTIEKLLPSNEEADEGYEITSVLDKVVGPLNCIVIDCPETNRHTQWCSREIELLL